MTHTPQLRRFWVLATAVMIAALTIFVHWPAVHNGFVTWDDPFYLVKVSELKRLSFASLAWAFTALPLYYHPLTWISHLIDFQMWGWNLAGHHATSILLHGVNTALVCLFVWMLTGRIEGLSSSTRLGVAAGVAIVFGIHPLQVESVAWLAERKTVLCGLFSLACLCAYLRASESNGGRVWWWTMTILFLAALLSKPMAISLPLVMLAMDFYPLHRHKHRSWGKLIGEKWFLLACCAAFGFVTIVAQSREGAITGMAGLGVWERCFLAARNVAFYIWKLIWPAWLSPYYPLEGKISPGDVEFMASVIGVILITTLAFCGRNRIPIIWAAWCAYLALIAPASGLLQVGPQGAGDRFMYFAMIPLLALAAAGCVWLWKHSHLAIRSIMAGLLGCLLLFYGLRTRDQLPVWRDDPTLWMTAVFYFPNSAFTNWKLAVALTDQHQYEAAQVHAEKAALLNPAYGPVHATLGEIYLRTHRYDAAVSESREALRLNPDLYNAQYTLARAYAAQDRLEQAFDVLRALITAKPEYATWASHDEDLAALRNQPEYAARFGALVSPHRN